MNPNDCPHSRYDREADPRICADCGASWPRIEDPPDQVAYARAQLEAHRPKENR